MGKEEVEGSGKVCNVSGGVVPNMTKYGGHPVLRAYVELMAIWMSGMRVVH